jgi:hypothetical protein
LVGSTAPGMKSPYRRPGNGRPGRALPRVWIGRRSDWDTGRAGTWGNSRSLTGETVKPVLGLPIGEESGEFGTPGGLRDSDRCYRAPAHSPDNSSKDCAAMRKAIQNTEAAPQAKRVADRRHLMKDLPLAGAVHEALQDVPPADEGRSVQPLSAPTDQPAGRCGPRLSRHAGFGNWATRAAGAGSADEATPPSRALTESPGLIRRGVLSPRAIGRTTCLSVKRVMRHLRTDRCPDWVPGRQSPTQPDRLAFRVDAWIEQEGTRHRSRAWPARRAQARREIGWQRRQIRAARRVGPSPRAYDRTRQ